jgi:hypothetical protein
VIRRGRAPGGGGGADVRLQLAAVAGGRAGLAGCRSQPPAAATAAARIRSQVGRDAGRRFMKASSRGRRTRVIPEICGFVQYGYNPSFLEVLAVTESHRRQLIDMVARPEDEVDLARAPSSSPATNTRSWSWIPICSGSTRWRRRCAAASAPPGSGGGRPQPRPLRGGRLPRETRASTTIRATASSTTCSTAAPGSRSPSPPSTSRWGGGPGRGARRRACRGTSWCGSWPAEATPSSTPSTAGRC